MHVEPWACGPETFRQWPPRRFPSSTKPSLGPWVPPPAHHPNREKGRTRAHQTITLNRLVPRLVAPCFLSSPLRYSSRFTTTIIITGQLNRQQPPHHYARGPNLDPHYVPTSAACGHSFSPPKRPTFPIQSFSPKIVHVATTRAARILGPSPHSSLVLALHTREKSLRLL